jgi:hypothetical protein
MRKGKAMSALLAHLNNRLVTRDELKTIPPPAATETWKPIAHYDLVHALDRQLAVRDIRIVKESFAVAHDGLRLFGVLDLSVPGMNGASGSEYLFALGLRTANDRSFATQIAVGATVLVCDNLAFSGDLIAMNRKHTAKFDLNADLSRAVDRYQTHLASFGAKFEGLKERHLSRDGAKALVFDAFASDVIPQRLFPVVAERYRPYEGESMTAWVLHNILTSAVKQLAPAPAFQASAGLGRLFGLTARS